MKFLILFIALIMSGYTNAQESTAKKDCCMELTATEKFAAFGSLQEFKDDHATPKPFELKNSHGTMETYNTPDGKTTTSYVVRSKERSNKYILVFHEWYG